LPRISRALDAVNIRIDRVIAWILLAALPLVAAATATTGKVLDTSFDLWLGMQRALLVAGLLPCLGSALLCARGLGSTTREA
jgi:TRAP-type mannitol/chloroaromatic compound transport system permease small subunit